MIKIGFLLSYDYEYIFTALPLVYDEADKIVISYDSEGKTWAGNKIEIPEDIFAKIKNLDKDGKIELYADKFFTENSQPMELETRQRNMMAAKMGKGGWHIQLDSDEFIYDFKKTADFLKKNSFLLKNPEKTPINFLVNWVVLFKKNKDGYFVIRPFTEKCFLITNLPKYKKARLPNQGRNIYLDILIIHQSWARPEEEILQKIQNWGHKNDFDVFDFFEKWKNIDESNFQEIKNFHPLTKETWQQLEFVRAKNIDDFIENFSKQNPQPDPKLGLSFSRKFKLYLKSL